MYAHKDYQGRGNASALADDLPVSAANKNISIVTSDVSITAKLFLKEKDFRNYCTTCYHQWYRIQ